MKLDLKPQNVLLTASGDAKLSDFGLATAKTSSASKSKGFAGTIIYSAPEALDVKRVKQRGKPQDVYSYAMILWEMYVREVPWEKEILESGYTPEDIKELVKSRERVTIPE